MKSKNYLDYVPIISARNTWSVQANNIVTVHVIHRGFYAWIAEKFFRRPHVTHIDLDAMGSFVFQNIDGQRNVGMIANLLSEKFGEDAEPLYERLIMYMRILYNNGFIYYKK